MTPTDAALNRWIAEFLGEGDKPCPDGPRGCESYICRPRSDGVWFHAGTYRDFCADPACTVMLMELLHKQTRSFLALIQVQVDEMPSQDIKHAVAEAFALANGYREEG